MTLKYIWRSFQPRLSFPRPFQLSFACFRVARSPSNSWASCNSTENAYLTSHRFTLPCFNADGLMTGTAEALLPKIHFLDTLPNPVKQKLKVLVVLAVVVLILGVYWLDLIMPLDLARGQPMRRQQTRSEPVTTMKLVKSPEVRAKQQETKVKLRFVFYGQFTLFSLFYWVYELTAFSFPSGHGKTFHIRQFHRVLVGRPIGPISSIDLRHLTSSLCHDGHSNENVKN